MATNGFAHRRRPVVDPPREGFVRLKKTGLILSLRFFRVSNVKLHGHPICRPAAGPDTKLRASTLGESCLVRNSRYRGRSVVDTRLVPEMSKTQGDQHQRNFIRSPGQPEMLFECVTRNGAFDLAAADRQRENHGAFIRRDGGCAIRNVHTCLNIIVRGLLYWYCAAQ